MQEKTPKYAGFWNRLLAHNIDLLPILLLFYGVSFIVPSSGYDYLLISGIYFLYHFTFETSAMQATPGKRWTKIKVTDSNGNHPSMHRTVIRNLTKFLSLILFFGGFIAIIFDQKRRALHDYIGGTLVLFDED
ncbi:MAG: RDD family protein [Ekhidna sp.]|uniref:RDD family protein n=1 Tax=Ekhidna sp. TaxID=2608089 RepID=UPI0032EB48D7